MTLHVITTSGGQRAGHVVELNSIPHTLSVKIKFQYTMHTSVYIPCKLLRTSKCNFQSLSFI